MYAALYRTSDIIAKSLALLGGAVLIAIIGLTCVSIAGRLLLPLDIGLGPIRGIYDYTEIAMATAIFAFLPLCHLNQGHAVVDLFDSKMPALLRRVLDLVFNVLMLGVAVYGTLRLYAGLQDKLRYGDTTQITQIPVWWGYAAGMVGATGFVIICVFCVLRAALTLSPRFRNTQSHV